MEKDIKETEKKEKDQNNKEKESEKFTIAEIRQYYAETLAKIKEIDAMLLDSEANTKTEKEKKDTLEEITSKIKLYREDFHNVMEFLPGHDKLQYSKNYEDELEKVNKLRNKLFPKKKFAFSKANKKQVEVNKDKIKEEKEKEKEQKAEELVKFGMLAELIGRFSDTYVYKEPILIGNRSPEKHSISWEENSDAELKKLKSPKK